jgi:hypothetical protein
VRAARFFITHHTPPPSQLSAAGATADVELQFPANLYGACAGVDVLKKFAGACGSTLNDTACTASKICKWTAIEAAEVAGITGSCDFAPTGRAELLFTTTASTAFNDAVAKAFSDCRAAENATQCAAVGSVQIQESKVADALAFVQPAKSAAAGARPLLHVFIGAASLAAAVVLGF